MATVGSWLSDDRERDCASLGGRPMIKTFPLTKCIEPSTT